MYWTIFFLMSFGIEVILIEFLSPFVRLMYMIELLILIFFFVILERKRKKEQWKVINLS